MIEKLLSDALTTKFTEEEYNDYYLVEIVVKKNDKIEVYIDSDTVLNLRNCQRISRHLEHLIEENGWLGEKYTLEVSSPGVDRPLKLHRQYKKNIGRRIRVINDEDETMEGKLTAVTEDSITVIKKEKKKEEELILPIDKIKKAKILVSFK
jgi:ribosome maturation factor RimP